MGAAHRHNRLAKAPVAPRTGAVSFAVPWFKVVSLLALGAAVQWIRDRIRDPSGERHRFLRKASLIIYAYVIGVFVIFLWR